MSLSEATQAVYLEKLGWMPAVLAEAAIDATIEQWMEPSKMPMPAYILERAAEERGRLPQLNPAYLLAEPPAGKPERGEFEEMLAKSRAMASRIDSELRKVPTLEEAGRRRQPVPMGEDEWNRRRDEQLAALRRLNPDVDAVLRKEARDRSKCRARARRL